MVNRAVMAIGALLALATIVVAADATRPTNPAAYRSDTARSTLGFVFRQAGAETRGTFKSFQTQLRYAADSLPASSLSVTVQIDSLDTGDMDRDTALRSAEFFDSKKYPTATFAADELTRRKDGSYAAAGKLTIRNVTRTVSIPLAIEATQVGGRASIVLRGATSIKRLDFGVGQGDWRSTEWVDDSVQIEYSVQLTGAPTP